ncbi:aggregation factor core [Octadecabacter sp. CECT 8868]|uniref:aggregation factor core n=1 Tax=Octadecabacter algicola TaxID=2909342 RepID=UPI001F15A358|nr:aggregation factor core [Octadecabacter algicola]MCF2904310.1 aggregation factor core [Octadecabacter algicola]
MRSIVLLGALLAQPFAANADINVVFQDGAPVDRFTIQASDGCMGTPFDLSLDLSGSAAGLIFDVTAQGAGVEVYQPLVLVEQGKRVLQVSEISDGGTEVSLSLNGVDQGVPVVFTADLDDTLGPRGITVSGQEMEGVTASVTLDGASYSATFDSSGVARVALPDCIS